ncbi:hypothetical protein A2Z22_00430 [Candidatus Woesebacteria bacterium RBG_16_34_12]|uniref:Lactamase n=1 Tax=Candidatus Woesebacteria bacterium RBG_16_34_12 TaxID=1802480 RepID=A0A1F7X912_9BACT|nr:MAG: hypothetical protein A2Z22_00430 [Candidatus Woesebacteria bacterium RBG_16_34_12]
MEINYLGHSSFRFKSKKISLITDPYDSEAVGLKYPKQVADIVTVSHDHDDHNKSNQISGVKLVIDGPGEYEMGGVSIIGIPTYHDNKKGELRGKNTVYIIEMDGLRIAHLGDLGQKFSEKKYEILGNIDILMIPVGGVYTIGSSEAVEIVREIEPTIIIPMHFYTPELNQKTFAKLAKVDSFLSELGVTTEKLTKLVVKKDLLGDDQRVVLLNMK